MTALFPPGDSTVQVFARVASGELTPEQGADILMAERRTRSLMGRLRAMLRHWLESFRERSIR